MQDENYDCRDIGFMIRSEALNQRGRDASILGMGVIDSVNGKMLNLRPTKCLKAIRVGCVDDISGQNWTADGIEKPIEFDIQQGELIVFKAPKKIKTYHLRYHKPYLKFVSICDENAMYEFLQQIL